MKLTFSFLNSPLSLRPWVSRLMLVAYMHALLQGIISPILASDQLQRPIPLYTLKIEKILEGVEKGGLTGSLSQSKGYLKTTSLQKFSGLQVCFEESTMLSNSSSKEESKSLSSSNTHLILRPGELSTYSHLQEVIKDNQSLGFSWNVDGYHQVFVSWDGSVTLQGLATTERTPCLLPALEISTFSSVMIKDTVADVLKIHALKTLIEGESHIQTLNFTGDIGQRGECVNHGDVTIKNIMGAIDSLTNHGKLSLESGNLTMNTLTNKGTFHIHNTTTLESTTLHNTGKFTAKKLKGTFKNFINDKYFWMMESDVLTTHQFKNHYHFLMGTGHNRFHHGINTGIIQMDHTQEFPTQAPRIMPYQGTYDGTYRFGHFDNYGDLVAPGTGRGFALQHVKKFTNKGVVSGKAVNINAREIVNETSGSFSIKELSMHTEKFTNKGDVHITHGMQTPHTTTIINTGTMKISDVNMPENYTFLKLENHGKFSLKGRKYNLESFINHENSTLTVEEGTEVNLPWNFRNMGYFESHSDSLFFDWVYNQERTTAPKLGNFTSHKPLSFNLLGWREQNSEFWLNLFTDPKCTLNAPIALWMDNLTLTKDMVIPFDLSVHLTGDFKMGKASLKAKSLSVLSDGNIFLNHEEKSPGNFAKIMTEGRLNFLAANIYAGHAQLASYGKMNLKATKFLDVGAPAPKTGSNLHNGSYAIQGQNGSYLFSHKKITLKSPKTNLDYSWISTYRKLSVTSKNPISHIAANTQVGENFDVYAPEFYHGIKGIQWVVMNRNLESCIPYHTHQMQVPSSEQSTLTVLGTLRLRGQKFTNYCSDLILGDFFLQNVTYKEIPQIFSKRIIKNGENSWTLSHHGTHASSLQIKNNLTFKDAPHVEFTGTQSIGGDLLITANTFTGHNHERHRSTVDTSTPLNIPVTTHIINEVRNNMTPPNKNRTTDLIVDPLDQLHPNEVEFYVQRQLHKLTGLSISLNEFIRNTKNLKSTVSTHEDLYKLDTSIIYYTYETVNEITYRHLNLHIAPKDRNPYRSIGDTYVGGNLSIITEDHQEHRNNRMVSRGPLHVFSKGTMNRITETYKEVTETIITDKNLK